MSIRGPFARSAPFGGGASVPLPTGTPPAPTGLPSPPTPTSSSNYSSDGTQSTNQQNTQSSTSPSSSPTTSGQPASASISTPFSPTSQSDGTSTNYKGSELSTDTLTSISPSSHSSMSIVGGAPTNGPPSGGGLTNLPPPVSMGGPTSQKSPTFGPPNSGPATSVSSDALSPSPPSKESGPSSGDLPSITLPSSLPSSIFTSPPVAIPTSPPSSILTSPPVAIPTSPPSSPPSIIPTSLPPPPTQKPSAPLTTSQSSTLPGQQTISQASSTTTSPIVDNPTTTSSIPSSSADKPSTTSDTSLSTPLPGTHTSTQQSTSPTTSTTSDTTTPGQQTSSQQSTSPTTSTISDTTPPGQQTSSQQSTSLLTSKSSTYTTTSQTTTDTSTPSTSSSQEGSLPSLLSSLLPSLPTQETIQSSATTSSASTDSKHSSETVATSAAIPTSSLTTDSHADTYTTLQSSQTGSSDSLTPTLLPTTFSGGSPTTAPGAQSSFAPQSPSGSSADTPISTGNAFIVSSAGSPTPPGSLAGNPSSAAQATTVSSNSHSYPTDLPPAKNLEASGTTTLPPSPPSAAPSGDSWSLATTISQSVTVFTITQHPDGTGNVVQTVTSSSPVTIPFWTPVPTSGARSNEAPIIGGVVGGVLALLLLCIAACYVIRRRRRSRTHQQLYDTDLTAPLSPAEATAMRENHPYSPTYNSVVGGQGVSESRGDLHHASGSFGSSAFPRLSIASSPHNFSRSLSGSVLHENFDRESNDGDISSDDESEGTERYFASAQSFYASDDGQSGIGIAIGSQSSTDLHSYHTAATTLFAGAHAVVDNNEECDSPGPSPSAFPIPPVNSFLDSARVIGLPDFVASRASPSRQAVSASSEDAALAPVKIRRLSEQQASWVAAVAAASPIDHDTPTPIAIRSLNALIDDEFNDDSSSQDLQTPTQSRPPATPFSDSSFIDNPFLRETSQEGFSDDSGGCDSHETVSIMYPYPFESRDKGKGKEYLSADLGGDPKNNRLSNDSSGIEFPENPSQCGLAL